MADAAAMTARAIQTAGTGATVLDSIRDAITTQCSKDGSCDDPLYSDCDEMLTDYEELRRQQGWDGFWNGSQSVVVRWRGRLRKPAAALATSVTSCDVAPAAATSVGCWQRVCDGRPAESCDAYVAMPPPPRPPPHPRCHHHLRRRPLNYHHRRHRCCRRTALSPADPVDARPCRRARLHAGWGGECVGDFLARRWRCSRSRWSACWPA